MPDVTKSPFFRPAEKPDFTQTPGGSRHRRKKPAGEEEHKSTVLGCSANLINAIVGSGIVGLPYAIQQAGFVTGICLVILCSILTEKSLRLLLETAKHAHVPSYETVAEAVFGRFGFLFVATNMFIMAYGAMLSYLMIVKDTFAIVLGVDPDNNPMKRAILFIISVTIMVPLSSQRVSLLEVEAGETSLAQHCFLPFFPFSHQDMADLAKTSSLNVTFDIIMVVLVLYCSRIQEAWETFDWRESIIHYDTVFVGLGVLSFAFVCQHSAFIIAGSLEKPTKSRWASATRIALTFACSLALMCGMGGYVGFQEKAQGNILNSLDESPPANLARALLGTTMLFVYPMESFVARHVCVVLFFEGRSAHEGDDTSVLNRRDRRITLTIILYLISVIPAAYFENLGTVLAISGAIGGSCLSYIGPGAVYLGVHGGRFLELSRAFFGPSIQPETASDEETVPLYNKPVAANLPPPTSTDSWLVRQLKNILWYLWLMPIWCKIASIGKSYLTSHVTDLAIKSPYPIRIGNVRFASVKVTGGGTRVVMLPKKGSPADDQNLDAPLNTMLIRADSLPKGHDAAITYEGNIVALPLTPNQSRFLPQTIQKVQKDYQSINKKIGAMAMRKMQEEQLALEDDPQQDPPRVFDFVTAIFYVIFGVVALVAGLVSIFKANE
jgi:sodium-coupled neutral amino acid transporter 11